MKFLIICDFLHSILLQHKINDIINAGKYLVKPLSHPVFNKLKCHFQTLNLSKLRFTFQFKGQIHIQFEIRISINMERFSKRTNKREIIRGMVMMNIFAEIINAEKLYSISFLLLLRVFKQCWNFK